MPAIAIQNVRDIAYGWSEQEVGGRYGKVLFKGILLEVGLVTLAEIP